MMLASIPKYESDKDDDKNGGETTNGVQEVGGIDEFFGIVGKDPDVEIRKSPGVGDEKEKE